MADKLYLCASCSGVRFIETGEEAARERCVSWFPVFPRAAHCPLYVYEPGSDADDDRRGRAEPAVSLFADPPGENAEKLIAPKAFEAYGG